MNSSLRFSAVRLIRGNQEDVLRAAKELKKLGREQGVHVRSGDGLASDICAENDERMIYTKEHADEFLPLEPLCRDYANKLREHGVKFEQLPLRRFLKSQIENGKPKTIAAHLLMPFLRILNKRLIDYGLETLPRYPIAVSRFSERMRNELSQTENSTLQARDVLKALEQGSIDLTQDRFNAPEF